MQFGVPELEDLPDVDGKSVLVRVDFNVPIKDGVIGDDLRIRAALPTINWLLERGARVTACTHLGRPKGKPNAEMSLAPCAERLATLLGKPVAFAPAGVLGVMAAEADDAGSPHRRFHPRNLLHKLQNSKTILALLRFSDSVEKCFYALIVACGLHVCHVDSLLSSRSVE